MAEKRRQHSLQPGDPRLIIRWTRRYAKSRTISFLVQWVFIVLMVLVVGVAAVLTNLAYSEGNLAMFSMAVLLMVGAMVFFLWFSVAPWGGELSFRITQWLYGREGYVAWAGEAGAGKTPWWVTALGGGLVAYHLLGALLVSFGYLRLEEMQPFSALYMCPFLIIMILYQQLGFWAWCWPLLYGLHGLVVFCGGGASVWAVWLDCVAWLGCSTRRQQIFWAEFWQLANMVAPVFGYGLIAIVVGHLYSRFALRQLKRVTRTGLEEQERSEEDTDEDMS